MTDSFESIADTATGLRALDLRDQAVREVVRSFDGAEVGSLYEHDVSRPFT